jgi:hypothetical protein
MITESIGKAYKWLRGSRAYNWIRDRQLVEIQKQVLDPKTNKQWLEYQTIVYTAQAQVAPAEPQLGTKFDVKA